MAEFFTLLGQNSFATMVFLVAFVVVILVFVISIFQGKEVSFWPPHIKPITSTNPKPEKMEDLVPIPNRILERRTYLQNIIKESLKSGNKSIILLSSGLQSRKDNENIAKLQDAWQSITSNTSVRILAESNEYNLVGACELLSRGVSVRFFKPTKMTALSFHVFRGNDFLKVIINQKDNLKPGNESPIALESIAGCIPKV